MQVIDLSMPIRNGMPFYPGDPEPKVRGYKIIEKDGYNMHELMMGTHTGTHVDAPNHFLVGGKTVDELDPLAFSGRAIAVASRERIVHSTDLAGVENHDIVLIYTGTGDELLGGPVDVSRIGLLDEGAAKSLVGKVKAVGIDSPSIGSPEVHRILLSKDIVIIENISSRLKALVGKSFQLYCLPLLIAGVDGAPARCVAIL